MPLPFPGLTRRVRHLATLVTALATAGAAACSDGAGLTEPQAPAPAAAPVSVEADGPPSTAITPGVSEDTLRTTTGFYYVRSGPGRNYKVVDSAYGGERVSSVCYATRVVSGGPTSNYTRLSTGGWIATGSIVRSAGAPEVPLCDSPAGPKVAPGLRGNDYPLATAPASGCIYEQWGYCTRQCTSFVSWRLREVNGMTYLRQGYGGVAWGMAKDWSTVAQKLGYRVDRSPEVGAVAQWTTNSSGKGHVAWVASVSSDKRYVTLEEYNAAVSRGYSKRTVLASSVPNFIHFY